MRIRRNSLLAVIGALLLAAGTMTGCKGLKNTEIVVTTGLSGNEVFKIGSSVCTLPEAMVYLTNYQNEYESVYGVEMWSHDFGGISLEEYVKNTVVARLANIKAMTLLAEEKEITLTEKEKKQAAEAAKTYFSSLNEEEIAYMKVTEEILTGMYEDYALADKAYQEITRDVNTEVSDDEARIITVQQIFMPTYRIGEDGQKVKDEDEKAEVYADMEKVAEKAAAGEDFLTLAHTYNKKSEDSLTIGRGQQGEAFDAAAFELEDGEISSIVETEQGYYLLKCVNYFDREATEENKKRMAEQRKDAVFNENYQKLIANTPSQFHTKLWENIHFELNESITTQDFFEVYNQYLSF